MAPDLAGLLLFKGLSLLKVRHASPWLGVALKTCREKGTEGIVP